MVGRSGSDRLRRRREARRERAGCTGHHIKRYRCLVPRQGAICATGYRPWCRSRGCLRWAHTCPYGCTGRNPPWRALVAAPSYPRPHWTKLLVPDGSVYTLKTWRATEGARLMPVTAFRRWPASGWALLAGAWGRATHSPTLASCPPRFAPWALLTGHRASSRGAERSFRATRLLRWPIAWPLRFRVAADTSRLLQHTEDLKAILVTSFVFCTDFLRGDHGCHHGAAKATPWGGVPLHWAIKAAFRIDRQSRGERSVLRPWITESATDGGS